MDMNSQPSSRTITLRAIPASRAFLRVARPVSLERRYVLSRFAYLRGDHGTLVLETPQKDYDIADEDPTPDPYDVKMMELLLS